MQEYFSTLFSLNANKTLSNARITILLSHTVPTEPGEIETYFMDCMEGDNRYDFDEFIFSGSIEKIYNSPSPRISLLDLLHKKLALNANKRAEWLAALNQLNSLAFSTQSAAIGLNFFLYDSAMNALSASSNYFTPKSSIGRIVQFVEALFRFLYLGIFVAIIAARANPGPKASGDQKS